MAEHVLKDLHESLRVCMHLGQSALAIFLVLVENKLNLGQTCRRPIHSDDVFDGLDRSEYLLLDHELVVGQQLEISEV